MDEISLGPEREIPLPSRRWRALGAAAAGAVAVGALTVAAIGTHHAATSSHAQQAAAVPARATRLPSPGCKPTQTAWPNLAALPAGMRPGAARMIIDAQFSGQCKPHRPGS